MQTLIKLYFFEYVTNIYAKLLHKYFFGCIIALSIIGVYIWLETYDKIKYWN